MYTTSGNLLGDVFADGPIIPIKSATAPACGNRRERERRAMNEVWKPVVGYEGYYEVSNLGSVKSLPRCSTSGKVLTPYVNKKNGYCYVALSKHNRRATKRVHVLVMNAFCPVDKKEGYDKNFTINHIDGNKTNNTLSNLEWSSQSENQRHAVNIGLQSTDGIPVICLDTGIVYKSFQDAAKSCGGSRGEMVARVCRGKRSHYRGMHFAMLNDYFSGRIPAYTGKVKRKASDSLWR